MNDTIRANIGISKDGATDEEIKSAAEKAYALDFIERIEGQETKSSLPPGFYKICGKRGQNLSGGEKQRVAIASVLLKKP